MTVRVIRGDALHLHGLSTDTKPVNNIPDGSDYYETDTGVFWFLDVDTWVPKNSLETIRALLAGIVNAKLTGSLVLNETNKVTTANTDILTNYTSIVNTNSVLMVLTNTAGVLSLEVDGILGTLNSGTALDAGKWYAFDVLMTEGSVYNLQFSVNATMQIKWIGGI